VLLIEVVLRISRLKEFWRRVPKFKICQLHIHFDTSRLYHRALLKALWLVLVSLRNRTRQEKKNTDGSNKRAQGVGFLSYASGQGNHRYARYNQYS
jgi:hypothetical protein